MHLDKGSILSDTYQHVNFSQLEQEYDAYSAREPLCSCRF